MRPRTHTHARTGRDGRSRRRHRFLSCSSSAFDPVDLRSSHGATLAVAGVRMPKGDGRDRDARGGGMKGEMAMREAEGG